ncbi:MAG: hypothetical protein JRN35_05645 [Nitrososphaerota archaeon]|nr:hypothetical protein [Nitrososphaerota archaeon]
MKIDEFDHRESQLAIPRPDVDGIRRAISSLKVKVEENGQSEFRTAILEEMERLGWSKRVKIAPDLNLTIAAMKGRIAACIQFGNVSRMYADLMKIQYLYDAGKCDAAVFVLLTKDAADKMASNLANCERLQKELLLFRSIINVPIKILAVE